MSVSAVFRLVLILFVLGIALGTFSYGGSSVGPLLGFALGFAALGAWPDRRGAIFLFLAFAFSTGWFIAGEEEIYWRGLPETGRVSGEVEIVRNPEARDFSRDAIVSFRSCEGTSCPEERILVRFPLSEPVSFGDKGRLFCELSLPEEEWQMYHAKGGVGFVCEKPEWEKRDTDRTLSIALMRFADRFEQSLMRALPEPESSLAAGLLLGGDGRLPAETKDDFRAAGLAHVVAVSGYNISIIAGYLLLIGIALFLPRRKAAIFAFFGTLAFVFVSGAPPSAVRAIGMASTLILAWLFGRRYASFHALLFAAAVMLAFDPLIIRHDLGFLLSFAATAGIILASPPIGRVLRRIPFFLKIFLEALLLTVAAELFILPIIFANFGHFSLAAFPANAILLPLVPIAMLLSFLAGVAGMLSGTLGTVFGFPAYVSLHVIISGAAYAASFEELDVVLQDFGWTEAVIWYGVLGVVVAIMIRARWRGGFLPERNTDIMRI
ncbi:MAG: ComEC/Rec2 family competence protein [Candidatus Moranbacteria bacterium]|nr:ComEC/Rec2 family competence protein [Candidatus Moranbacteria bacterium]